MHLILLAAYGQSILHLKSHTQTTSVCCHLRKQGCLLPFAQAGVHCHWLTPKPNLIAAIRVSRAVCCHSLKQGYYVTGSHPNHIWSLPFVWAGLFAAIPASRGTMPLVLCPNVWTLYRLTWSARRRTTCIVPIPYHWYQAHIWVSIRKR